MSNEGKVFALCSDMTKYHMSWEDLDKRVVMVDVSKDDVTGFTIVTLTDVESGVISIVAEMPNV